MREYCEQQEWEIVAVETEPGLRGWQDDNDRPALARCLAAAAERTYDILLVYDLSRFARSVRIQETLVHRLERYGVALASVREPYVATPLFRQILSAFAEETTRQIAGHTRRALVTRVRRGLPHGVAPWGYVRAEPKGPYVPDPATAHEVTLLFRRYADGWHLIDLALDLGNRGIPTPRGLSIWRPESVAQILDNRTYLGEVSINGERIPGAHQPLVDATTWAIVEARRAEGARAPRAKLAASWLEGLLYHDCGEPRGKMYLYAPARPKRGSRPYFRCNKIAHEHPTRATYCRLRPSSIAAWIAEARVRAILRADLPRAVSPDAALRAARAEQRQSSPLAERHRQELAERAARAMARRRKAEDLYLSGARDRAWFDAQDAQIAAELAAVATAEQTLPAPVDEAALREAARWLADIAAVVDAATDEEMAAILRAVGVAVLGRDGVRVEYRGVFARLLG